MNTAHDRMHLRKSGMLTLNWRYSECKERTHAGPIALTVCLYDQREHWASDTDYIMKDILLAFTDAFEQAFCYVDQRNLFWLNYFH